MHPNFNKAHCLATGLLLQQEISGLYIDVLKFVFNKKIIIDTIQNYCKITHRSLDDFMIDDVLKTACTVKIGKLNLILYNSEELNGERKHWSITHEIGHIYCGHKKDGPIEEIEANYFAAQIVMPEIVLIKIAQLQGKIEVSEIYDNFNVSLTAACKRINTLNRRFGFNCSNQDKSLLAKFDFYVLQYVSNNFENKSLYTVNV